jgi:hypothetical protein
LIESGRYGGMVALSRVPCEKPVELGRQYRDLRQCLQQIDILAGCCGTDHRPIKLISWNCGQAAGTSRTAVLHRVWLNEDPTRNN